MKNPRILFVGGGSVGHIAPSVAVWSAIQKEMPDAHAHFVCSSKKDDIQFLQNSALNFSPINAPRLSFSFLWKYAKAKKEVMQIFDTFKPDVVFSKGGYVSLPLCAVAKKMNIPIVLHESDAVSGRANTLVSKWAKVICTGFDIKGSKYKYTGNPVRTSIQNGKRQSGLEVTGFSGDKPILLVIGGSQGAQNINESIVKLLPELLKTCDVIHITGRGKQASSAQKGYFPIEFVNEGLADLYAITDIAVSRAGAGAIGELAANSIATILVPLRGVGHDHQQKNAVVLQKNNACILLQQEELQTKLVCIVKDLLLSKERLTTMQRKIHSFYNEKSAQQIANTIMNCIA